MLILMGKKILTILSSRICLSRSYLPRKPIFQVIIGIVSFRHTFLLLTVNRGVGTD